MEYASASAEELFPLADHSADLITAAQAAHWFDLPRFYEEVRRIGAPHAVLALVSYGVVKMNDDLDPRFSRFYWMRSAPTGRRSASSSTPAM